MAYIAIFTLDEWSHVGAVLALQEQSDEWIHMQQAESSCRLADDVWNLAKCHRCKTLAQSQSAPLFWSGQRRLLCVDVLFAAKNAPRLRIIQAIYAIIPRHE
jgi:hypothetical protein